MARNERQDSKVELEESARERKASKIEEDHDDVQDITPGKVLHVFGWLFPRILAVIFFIVLFFWIFQAEGGLGVTEDTLFGWHALCMSLFIVVFTQEAVLSFSAPLISGPFKKGFRTHERNFHIVCHVCGIICAMLGIVAIVYYKNLSPQPIEFPFYAVYSPHSWLGIAVLILWGLQLLAGLYIHIFGKLSANDKKLLNQIHRYLGKVVYAGGLATCALGLQDMQSSDLCSSSPPMPGMYDTAGMGQMDMSGMSMNMSGYYPDSPEAQYSSGGTVLLLALGMATFGVLEF